MAEGERGMMMMNELAHVMKKVCQRMRDEAMMIWG